MSVKIVVDLSYGDAGKGTTVDYLTRQSDAPTTVVRYNGGAQAAHNVVTPDGRHHTFSQFGSGTFVPGTRTFLSEYMLVKPDNMLREAEHLEDLGVNNPLSTVYVDQFCAITTPFHGAANRFNEILRGNGNHGSCGVGIGETMRLRRVRPDLSITAHNLDPDNSRILKEKLHALKTYYGKTIFNIENFKKVKALGDKDSARISQIIDLFKNKDVIDDLIKTYHKWYASVNVVGFTFLSDVLATDNVIFEGAQGVLLDADYGFFPYVTYSHTTDCNARQLLSSVMYSGDVKRLGILRTYTTRHGNGPHVTEDQTLPRMFGFAEDHNYTSRWQGRFRVGWFDFVAHQYAVAANGGVDALVVTGADRFPYWKFVTQYNVDPTDQDFFDGGHGINVSRDLAESINHPRMSALSAKLLDTKPANVWAAVSTFNLFEKIIGRLGAEIALYSEGPTANDKVLLDRNII